MIQSRLQWLCALQSFKAFKRSWALQQGCVCTV